MSDIDSEDYHSTGRSDLVNYSTLLPSAAFPKLFFRDPVFFSSSWPTIFFRQFVNI